MSLSSAFAFRFRFTFTRRHQTVSQLSVYCCLFLCRLTVWHVLCTSCVLKLVEILFNLRALKRRLCIKILFYIYPNTTQYTVYIFVYVHSTYLLCYDAQVAFNVTDTDTDTDTCWCCCAKKTHNNNNWGWKEERNTLSRNLQ